jgi:ABC-type transport system involved in multi-copper enzyme maturation permease subunit
MIPDTTVLLVGAVLGAIQVLAAVPWVGLLLRGTTARPSTGRKPSPGRWVGRWVIALGAAVVVMAVLFASVHDTEALEVWGHAYSVVLQLQLSADFFIAAFAVLLWLWPKGAAVALAAFREGVRQPMFWLIAGMGLVALLGSVFIPYFTFGDDALMIRDLGNEIIMLCAALFGTLAASISVSEEIEGRTAVTLMSKPVSRRQFLLGKFVGIALAALVIYALLGVWFEGMLLFHRWWTARFDFPDPRQPSAWLAATLASWSLPGDATDFLRGSGMWFEHVLDTLPGLVLSYSQVMVLVAITVSLATRVPMVVNLATVWVVIYPLAHLNPVLLAAAQQAQAAAPGSTVAQLVAFMAQVSDTLLPNLSSFRIDPALLGDTPPPAAPFAAYIGAVSLYGILYTGIALLFGLILFEDRDLA